MRRAVLAQADRVVRHHIGDRRAHQRRQPDRRAAIVGEHHERAAVGPQHPVQRDAVHRRRHAVFADAVVDVGAREIPRRDRFHALAAGEVRAGQIGGAADAERQDAVDHLQRHLARLAGRHLGRGRRKLRLVSGDGGGQGGRVAVAVARKGFAVGRGGEFGLPRRARLGAARRDPAPGGIDAVGDLERRVGPAQRGAGGLDLGGAERGAVHVVAALLVRRAKADDGAAGDQAGARVGLRRRDRIGDLGGVVAVHPADVPARGGEARQLIGRGGQAGVAVDGDPVVVPQHHQTPEAQMPGEVDRLMADPLHQTAVAGQHIGIVVDQAGVARRRHPLRQRHADRGGDALAQRPGGGLDACGVAVFRVARRAAADLAEGAQLVHVHVGVAEQVVDRVKQHRAVPRRQHEAVAVRPFRRLRVERDEAVEQHRGDIGHAHRHARMAGVGLLHRVHGQRPDGVGHGALVGGGDLGVHGVSFQARLLSRTRRSISGVRMSCIARSSLLPGMTIEFARLIHEPWIIEVR